MLQQKSTPETTSYKSLQVGTEWEADILSELKTSTIVVEYSTAEHCTPVWINSTCNKKVYSQWPVEPHVHITTVCALRIIFGILKSTLLNRYRRPTQCNIGAPALRQKQAS